MYHNQLSIYEGSDSWAAIKKAAKFVVEHPYVALLTDAEHTDLKYFYEEMEEVEKKCNVKLVVKPSLVEQQHLECLDRLRETGVMNMFGAAGYLAQAFDIDKEDAKIILKYWMDSFSERHPQE